MTSDDQIARIMQEYRLTGRLAEIDLHTLATVAWTEGNTFAYRAVTAAIDNFAFTGKYSPASTTSKGVSSGAAVVNG